MERRGPDRLTAADLPQQLERFRVLSLLGEGGMARVFRVQPNEATGLPRECALKVLHKAHARNDPDLARALKREGRVTGLLDHPNIVHTWDIGTIEEQPYVLMELVRGPTVEQLLEDERRLPTRISLGIAEDVARGLHHAHNATDERGRSLGLVHRDLKPSNVIVTPRGVAKVMDFGIAKIPILPGMTTKPGEIRGSPRFMSPEQVAGERLDHRSDLFSLATLIYEMITGRALFASGTVHGVWMRIVDVENLLAQDASFARIRKAYPDLAELLLRCFQTDPDARPASALVLADELAALRAKQAPGESLRRMIQRNPGWLTLPMEPTWDDLGTETFESRPGAELPQPPPELSETMAPPDEPRPSPAMPSLNPRPAPEGFAHLHWLLLGAIGALLALAWTVWQGQ